MVILWEPDCEVVLSVLVRSLVVLGSVSRESSASSLLSGLGKEEEEESAVMRRRLILPDSVLMLSFEVAVTRRWPFTLPLLVSMVVKMTRAGGVAGCSGWERCWPGCFLGSSLVGIGGGSVWVALDLEPKRKEKRPPPERELVR